MNVKGGKRYITWVMNCFQEIIRIYRIHWTTEVLLKTAKSLMKLQKEFQSLCDNNHCTLDGWPADLRLRILSN